MEHAINDIVRCLVSQDHHDVKSRDMNIVDALLKLDRTISYKRATPTDEVVEALHEITEAILELRNCIRIMNRLLED